MGMGPCRGVRRVLAHSRAQVHQEAIDVPRWGTPDRTHSVPMAHEIDADALLRCAPSDGAHHRHRPDPVPKRTRSTSRCRAAARTAPSPGARSTACSKTRPRARRHLRHQCGRAQRRRDGQRLRPRRPRWRARRAGRVLGERGPLQLAVLAGGRDGRRQRVRPRPAARRAVAAQLPAPVQPLRVQPAEPEPAARGARTPRRPGGAAPPRRATPVHHRDQRPHRAGARLPVTRSRSTRCSRRRACRTCSRRSRSTASRTGTAATPAIRRCIR